ncbi:MAG: hypothetical protein ACREQV_04720 [Candidatus Binatia bacterium]
MALLASQAASGQGPEEVEQVSICQLAKAGEKMNGRHIRLTAIYLTDLLEISVLKDRRCPSEYFAPNWKLSQDPSLDAFDKVLYSRPDDLNLTTFSIDVSGIFVWWVNEKPQGSLILEKVWSFKRVCGDWKESK